MTHPNTDAAFAREHGLKGTEMTLNTDLTDLSDVTDEGLEAALSISNSPRSTFRDVRRSPAVYASVVMLARCLQAHYPDMHVDPVTRKARELVKATDFLSKSDDAPPFKLAKAAILAGMAMRGEG